MSKNNHKPFFYGWIIVGVAFLIGLTQTGVFQNILSIFMKPMAQEFGWSRSAFTGAIAIGSLFGGFLSPFTGRYLDRHGPRFVAFWGILVLSAGLAALTVISKIWQLYLLFGIGRMVATGVLGLVIVVSVSNWFEQKRGRAMGITMLGTRIGMAVFPPLTQFLIVWLGWRLAWAGLGITVFLLSAVPSLIFLKRRPEDLGLLPDGRKAGNSSDNDAREKKSHQSDEPKRIQPVWARRDVLKTRAFWMILAAHSCLFFVGAGINFHIYPFFTDSGLNSGLAVLTISIISICGAAGGLLMGLLADHVSVRKLLFFLFIAQGTLFFFIFQAVASSVTVFAFAITFGILRGGIIPLLTLVWVEFYGRESSGTVIGLGGPIRLTANALGPISAALAYDFLGSYHLPFFGFSFIFVLSGILVIFAKPPRHPKQPVKKAL